MDIVATLKREEAKLQRKLAAVQGAIRALAGVSRNGNYDNKRHGMSAAGRARIAAAQRKRWAKIKSKRKAA